MELNHRPHAYQACALTNWAIGPKAIETSVLFAFYSGVFRPTIILLLVFPPNYKDHRGEIKSIYSLFFWDFGNRTVVLNTYGGLPGYFLYRKLLRKEVIQPQVPLRLPCYDFTPIATHTFGTYILKKVSPVTSGTNDFRGVTGGVYKARERIHRGMLIHDY